MSPSIWPDYRGSAIRQLANSLRLFVNPEYFRNTLVIAVLLSLYLAGLFLPLPGVLRVSVGGYQPWWFVVLLDFLFTGGALGRASVLSMGMFGPMILGSSFGRRNVTISTRLQRGFTLLTASMLVAATLHARRMMQWNLGQFALVSVCIAAGAIFLKFVNSQLVRRRGPGIFYINLWITAFVSLRNVTLQLASAHQYAVIAMTGSVLFFIFVSLCALMRTRVRLTVESVKVAQDPRRATLEIAGIDEASIDNIGGMWLIFYICIAGFVSLVLGWRSVTAENYPAVAITSIVAFAAVCAAVVIAKRLPGFAQLLGNSGPAAFGDPRGYALRMLNNFWIIPSQTPGRETEAFISTRMSAPIKRAMVLFSSWLVLTLVLQYEATRRGCTILLFPYGPLVIISILAMLTGNVSMILRHIAMSTRHFAQLRRGQKRVLAETYPLRPSGKPSTVSLSDIEEYWEEEKISDQWRDMVDWINLARQMQLVPAEKPHRRSIKAKLLRLVIKAITGAIISFAVGALCVLFFPDTTRKDLGLVVLPLFFTTVIAPDAILRFLVRLRPR